MSVQSQVLIFAVSGPLLLCACQGSGESEGDADTDRGGDGDGDLRGDGDGDLPGDGDGDLSGDGDGDSGTGGTSGSGDPGTVTQAGALYTVKIDALEMVIDSASAGRIVSFKIGGQETLVLEGDAAQYGSTFWPSPQNWPWLPGPGAAIDSEPYVAVLGQNEVTMTSSSDEGLNITVTKKFAPAPGQGIRVTYGITNDHSDEREFAAWEISRLASGVAYYAPGPGGVTREDGGTELTTENGGYRWFSYPQGQVNVKHLADGTGWLAAAVPGDNPVVVFKDFADIPQTSFALGEAEIELYGDASGSYYELEQQGPAESLGSGDSLSWEVLWKGMALKPGTDLSPGSAALVSAAVSLGG